MYCGAVKPAFVCDIDFYGHNRRFATHYRAWARPFKAHCPINTARGTVICFAFLASFAVKLPP
jgi:hypothetical protein